MAKSKEKTIKNLRRARIWPSVVLLVLSFVVSFAAFMFFLINSMVFLVQDRFSTICEGAESVSRLIDPVNIGEITNEKLSSASDFTDALYVLDKDGEVIAGFGAQSYDLNSRIDLSQDFLAEEDYIFYLDSNFGDGLDGVNLIGSDGALHLEYLLQEENVKEYVSWFDGEHPEHTKPLFNAWLWTKFELSDGSTALIKCTVPLYYKDFLRSAIMAVGAMGLMQVAVIFMFVNVIVNCLNQRKMTKLIYTDTVTGGHSYVYFENYAGKMLSRGYGRTYVVADITLMKYRSYCSYHGVQAGELLLENVDKLINSHLDRKDICAYSGKSSFALFLRCTGRENGEQRVRQILGDLSEKFAHGGIVFHAGIYFSEPDRQNSGSRITDPADCFNRASAARALATDENTVACIIYNDKLLEEQLWEHKVEEKMQAALEKEEFKVYIQPKYDPVTEKLAGAEALVRWINEEDGFISPGRFIPIFEKNGFITKLDDYMLSHVAKLQAGWLAEGKNIVPVSVNVSRAHFANPDLAQHICSLVDQYNVPHHFIEIELTESAFFDDKAALLRTVHQLRELGFEISMDDFGAGYSSLNSLKDLPLDVLKLDAEFFRGEDEENRGEIVVSQAILLAKSLNMRIVAEGVEKKEQVDFLASQGCDMIQGYYFAKPMPADEYEQRL